MNNFNVVKDVIPTPIETINALGCGGLRQGTITEVWGSPKSGKSTFSYQTASKFLERYPKKGIVLIIDSELSVDEIRLKHAFDLEVGTFVKSSYESPDKMEIQEDEGKDHRVILAPGMTIEMAGSMIRNLGTKYLRQGHYVLVIWDSITASQPASEYDEIVKSIKDGGIASQYSGGMMLRARVLKFELNNLLKVMYREPISILLINQATTKIGQWRSGETSGGGYGKEHNIHYKIRFSFKKSLEQKSLGISRGTYSIVDVEKSKFTPRVSNIPIYIYDDLGGVICPKLEVLEKSRDFGLIKQSGPWYSLSDELKDKVPEGKDSKFHGWENFVKNSDDLMPLLQASIIKKIREDYSLVNFTYKVFENEVE